MAPPGATRPAWIPAGDDAPPPPPGRPGWPPPAPPPPSRHRRPLLALLALLLVTVLVGGGLLLGVDRRKGPSPTSVGPAPSSTRAAPTTRPPVTTVRTPAAVRAVQSDVTELRGLRFRRQVPVTIESPAKLARRLLRTLDDETDETDEADEARVGRALAVLGQLPQGTDLPRLRRRIQAESVLGFYLPGRAPKGRLYVRSSRGLDPYAKVVLAHELTHALTDQHYDLTRSDRLAAATGRDDEQTAYSALIEGDATLVMQRYLRERLSPAEQAAAGQASAGDRTPRRDAAPAVIREPMLFPYRDGLRFVFLLYQAGGWAAVNRAYRDPPTSTEQILHPDRYLGRRDRPQKVTVPAVSGRLGTGWRPGTEIGFGELDVRLLLQERLSASAAEAAAGWDGGRLRTFERAGRTALVLRTVWDSAAEASEYCDAMARWATIRFGAGSGRRWTSPTQRTALLCRGSHATFLSAPDQSSFRQLLAATPRP